jgi:hypothetical protein
MLIAVGQNLCQCRCPTSAANNANHNL